MSDPSGKETVEAATILPREREQQWTAQQLWDAPQVREWLVNEFKRRGSLERLCQVLSVRTSCFVYSSEGRKVCGPRFLKEFEADNYQCVDVVLSSERRC